MKEKNLREEPLNSASVVGILIGSVIAVETLKKGRRYSMIVAALFSLSGIAFTMIQNYWILISGRLLIGIGSGLATCSKYRFIEEYVPQRMMAQCIAIDRTITQTGMLIGQLWAVILPPDSEPAELESN